MPRQMVDAQNVASDVPRPNLLVNGGFEYWQRGNGPFSANGGFHADRWSIALNGTDTLSVSKDTSGPDLGSVTDALVTFTAGSASNSSIFQDVKDINQLRGKTVSASVRVRSTVGNGARIYLISDGTNAGGVYSAYNTAGGYVTLYANGATVPSDATFVRIYVIFTVSGTYYVDNAMVVMGPVAPDYYPMHPADDLLRCLRYYESFGGQAAGWVVAMGFGTATSAANVSKEYKAIKPVNPQITYSAASTWGVSPSGGPLLTCTSITTWTNDARMAMISPNVASGLTVGAGVYIAGLANYTATVVAEANP